MDFQQPNQQQPGQQPVNQQPDQNIQPNPVVDQPPKNIRKIVMLTIIGILILGSVSYGAYYWWPKNNKPVACTQEAKQCPDGSYVSRTGPNCEFAACPADETANWQTYKNEKYGIEFKYPIELSESVDTSELSTKYSDATQTYIFDSGGELYNMKHGLAVSVISKALAYNGSGLPWWSGGASVSAMNVGNHIWYLHPMQDEVCGGTNAMTEFGSRMLRVYFTNACDDNDHLIEIDQRLINQVLSTFKFTK